MRRRTFAYFTASLLACALFAAPAFASDDVSQGGDSVTQEPPVTQAPPSTPPPSTTPAPTTSTPTPTTTVTPTSTTPTTATTTPTTTTTTPTTTTTTTPLVPNGAVATDDGDALLNSLLDSSADDCDDGTCDVPTGPEATLGTGVGPAVLGSRRYGGGLPYTGIEDTPLPLLLAVITILGGITIYRYTLTRDRFAIYRSSLPRTKVRGYDSGYGWALSRLVSRNHLSSGDE